MGGERGYSLPANSLQDKITREKGKGTSEFKAFVIFSIPVDTLLLGYLLHGTNRNRVNKIMRIFNKRGLYISQIRSETLQISLIEKLRLIE